MTPPWSVVVAVLLAAAAVLIEAVRSVSGLLDTSLADEALTYWLAIVIGAAVLLGNLFRGRSWAWVAVLTLSAWQGFRWVRFFWQAASAGSSLLAALMTSQAVRTAFYLAVVGLLLVPTSAIWFWQDWGRLRGRLKETPVHILVAWIVFAGSLLLLHFSYWDTIEFQGRMLTTAREGNSLFGLVAASGGLYLSLAYAVRSFRAARSDLPSSSPSGLFLLSLAVLGVSVAFPAKSLGYAALLTVPLQLLVTAVCLVVLAIKSWRHRVDRTYRWTLSVVVLLALGLVIAILTVLYRGRFH